MKKLSYEDGHIVLRDEKDIVYMKALYKLGRYRHKESGKTVNIWKFRRGAYEVLAYRPQGKPPVIVTEQEFYSLKKWEKVSE
jgi:hypothetical protein